MKKLTEAEKKAKAERRAAAKSTERTLAIWDIILSGVLAVLLLIWLFVYGREGVLQGAIGSVWFWTGMVAGLVLLGVLARKLMSSAKVARKS